MLEEVNMLVEAVRCHPSCERHEFKFCANDLTSRLSIIDTSIAI